MMKSFLHRYYHLVLLGVAVLATTASAVLLFMQSTELEAFLKGQTGRSGRVTHPTLLPTPPRQSPT